MKDQRHDYLEVQKIELGENEEEVKRLKAKWFKLSATMKFIDFLEYVCQEKKKLIISLEKFLEKQDNKKIKDEKYKEKVDDKKVSNFLKIGRKVKKWFGGGT